MIEHWHWSSFFIGFGIVMGLALLIMAIGAFTPRGLPMSDDDWVEKNQPKKGNGGKDAD